MLQVIRDKTSGWIAYLIIGLISIPFALWGINSYLGGGEEQPAAVVNGDNITPRQLDYAYTRYRERLASVFGGKIPAVFNDENTLREQALSQLIEEKVLTNYISDKGYRVGDKELFASIQKLAMFQQDGKFSSELYQNQLASQGYSPALFEQEIRRSQEMEQLSLAVKSSAFSVPVELDKFNGLKNQQRKLRTLTVKNQTDSIEVSEQQLSDYYNEQSARFMEPAKVKLDYIELNLKKIMQTINVSEEQLLDRYEQMKEQLTTPEIREASHILLKVTNDTDQNEVKQKIQDLKTRIDKGEDFASLAGEFSQDPGSAKNGGDLGEVGRGDMVKPFETALFDLKVGEVSDPVKTKFGWHLIKLNSLSGGETKTFEQARAEIEQELKTDMAESQIYDLAENLASIGYEEPDSLLPAAEQLDLKIQTTDWFSRNQGTGLAAEEKIRQIAFSDEVLNSNLNSETIELSDNRVVIVHLKDHQKSRKKSLESVKDSIINTLKVKLGREQAQSAGKKMLVELKQDNKSLDDIATEHSLQVEDLDYVSRSDKALSQDVVNAAFTIQKPSVDHPAFQAISTANGDYTIIELSGVRINPESQDNAKDESQKSFNSARANYDYQALVKALTAEAEVTRFSVKDIQTN